MLPRMSKPARSRIIAAVMLALLLTAPVHALSPGEVAPEVGIVDLQGKPVRLAELRGKVVLVDFWASWCAPCREELPWLEKLYTAQKSRGLEIVAVNQDESIDNARRFLQAHPLSFRVAHDVGGKVADRFSPAKMPSSFLVDAKGKVRFVHAGFRAADAKAIEAEVSKLLAELPQKPQ
jgi:peroxiredoxin